MKNWLKNLKNLSLTKSEIYTLFLPVVVWFSYFPNIHFGRIAGANIELSLVLIYLVGFVLIHAKQIIKSRSKLISNKAVILVGVFVLWSSLSILWTSNFTRALLTVAIMLVLYGSLLAFLSMPRLSKLLPHLVKIYLATAVVVSIVAIIQVIYGAWTEWGICKACGWAAFGFVRPGVFAIEPQFLGSLLIVPVLVFTWRIIKNNFSWLLSIGLVLTTIAMYLTLSRGAIYALVIGLIVLAAYNLRQYVRLALVAAMMLASVVIGMVFHATATELNTRISDNFYDSISKSVNHTSMGLVELPELAEPLEAPSEEKNSAFFDGYVEKSTDERVNMLTLSLDTWRQSLQTVVVGVGVGGTGVSVLEYTKKTGTPAEITQNQYAETLLEVGVVGLGLFIAILAGLLYRVRLYGLLVAIIIAHMLQWNMFSGYPNALHVYLVLMLIYCFVTLQPSKRAG